MLIRYEPFREFDRFTEDFLSERRARQIPVDAYRRGNEFKIHLDLPGVDSRFIELTVEQDVLTVRATRAWVRTVMAPNKVPIAATPNVPSTNMGTREAKSGKSST